MSQSLTEWHSNGSGNEQSSEAAELTIDPSHGGMNAKSSASAPPAGSIIRLRFRRISGTGTARVVHMEEQHEPLLQLDHSPASAVPTSMISASAGLHTRVAMSASQCTLDYMSAWKTSSELLFVPFNSYSRKCTVL